MSQQTPKTKSITAEKFANALNEDLKIVNRIRERSLSSGSNEKLLVRQSKDFALGESNQRKDTLSSANQILTQSARQDSPLSQAITESAKKIINTNAVHVNKWALHDNRNNSATKKEEEKPAPVQNENSMWDRKVSFKHKLISESLNRLKPSNQETENPIDELSKVIERTRVTTTDIFTTKDYNQGNRTTNDESFQSIKLKDVSFDQEKEDILAKTEERIQQYKFHAQSPQTNKSRSPSKSPSKSSISPNRSLNKSPSDWKKSQQEIQEAIERAASLPKRLETSYSDSDISTGPVSRNQSFVAKPKPHHERNTSFQLDVVKKFQNNTEIKEENNEETERVQAQTNQRSSLRTPDFNQQQSSKRRANEALASATIKSAKSKTPTNRSTRTLGSAHQETSSQKRIPLANQPKSATSSKSMLKTLTQSQSSSKKTISTSASKKEVKSIIGVKNVSRAIENEILRKIKPTSIDNSYASYKKLNQSLNLSRKDLLADDQHDKSFDKKNLNFDPSPIKHDLSLSLNLGNDFSKDESILKAEILKNPELTTEYELFVKLEEVIQKVSIKHFMHLRNILKPHSSIHLLCQSLVKLMAGLDEFLPYEFIEKKVREVYLFKYKLTWNEIRILFNIPSRFLNLISFFKELVVKGDIPIQNLNAAESALNQIKNPPPKSEAYTVLFDFMCYAIQFYRHFLKIYDEDQTFSKVTEIDHEPQIPLPEKLSEQPIPHPFSSIKKRKNVATFNSSLVSSASQKKVTLQETVTETPVTKIENSEKPDPNRNNDSMLNYFEEHLENGNKSLVSIGEKKRELLKKLESYANNANSTPNSKPSVRSTTPKSSSKIFDKENNSKSINRNKSVTPSKSEKILEKHQDLEKAESPLNTFYGDKRLYKSIKDVIVYDKIEDNEKEARDYRHRVKKLLADHEKFVKNQILEEQKAASRFDRQELMAERKRFLAYMENQMNKEENFMREMKQETFQNKKDNKERAMMKAKANQYDELVHSYNNHLMNEALVQNKKADKMKLLHDSQQNMAIKKLLKKKKESEEQAQLFEELAERSKKRLESKLQAAESEKKKWQKDYILLTNLILDAK